MFQCFVSDHERGCVIASGCIASLSPPAPSLLPVSDVSPVPAPLPSELLVRPVLVVEDEVMIAWMIESLLEDMGFSSVTIVSSGEDAVAAAVRLHPALLVSDINLGSRGMDGIAAAVAISAVEDPMILFVTAHAGSGEVGRIGASVPGALVLRKPVERAELARAVASLAAGFLRH